MKRWKWYSANNLLKNNILKMESKRNENYIKKLELSKKKSEESWAIAENIFKGVSDGLNVFINHSKEIELISKQNLERYFNRIKTSIIELTETEEICQFLIAEKGKCLEQVIGYGIKKQGLLGADYQTAIDKIIDPLFKQYELKLEFEKKHPTVKKYVPNVIVYKPNSEKLKISENKTAIENVKTIPKPTEEEIIPESVETDIKLPSNFEQIICDGTEQEIMNDFMLLASTKNKLNNECYMNKKDVEEFVKKNFSVFNSIPTGKYFEINLLPKQKTILIHFIYQFTVKYNRRLGVPKLKYAMLLINNFELFKNDKAATLVSNMSESKKPKSPLDIILIPKRVLA